MTLRQLEIFLAVADNQSFSKGSEQVSLAQSTASQQIRHLEEQLGIRLFDRTTSQVALTAVGKLVYEHAQTIMQQVQNTHLAIKRFQGVEQAPLLCAASTIPACYLVPGLLQQFKQHFPGIKPQLLQGGSTMVIDAVRSDQAEFGLVGMYQPDPVLSYQAIWTDQIVLVAAPGLIDSPQPITPEVLSSIPMIIRESGSGTGSAVIHALTEIGMTENSLSVYAKLSSSEAVREAVIAGLGAAFISWLAVKRDGEDSDVGDNKRQ
jgi:DNA-binding transcriptional LysR family regulator